MNFDFRKAAVKAVSFSPLMENRNKITTEDIIKKFPEGFTLKEFDMIQNANSPYPVFTIVEDDSIYYSGGEALKKIVNSWIDNFEGDVEKTAEEFAKTEGLKVKLSTTRTKSGRNFTVVEIL